MRKLMVLTLFAAAVAAISALAATAQPRGTNGRILVNADAANGQEQVYTLNPDGSDPRLLATDAEAGQWSPDGTRIPLVSDDGERLVDPDNSASVDLQLPALYPDMFLGCGVWSPDATTLACEGFGGAGDGVYTVRSSDGGDLQRVTSGADDDCAGDYSPNGKQIVFLRSFFDDRGIAGLFTVRTDGTGLRQIVNPVGMDLNFDCGSWSPQRNEILFSAHVPDGRYRSTVWVVHSDGSGMHELPIAGCGGLADDPTTISCRYASWSPDGQKIVFSRFSAATGQRDLYTVDSDGSGLTQVTHTPGIDEFYSDWGVHPATR